MDANLEPFSNKFSLRAWYTSIQNQWNLIFAVAEYLVAPWVGDWGHLICNEACSIQLQLYLLIMFLCSPHAVKVIFKFYSTIPYQQSVDHLISGFEFKVLSTASCWHALYLWNIGHSGVKESIQNWKPKRFS